MPGFTAKLLLVTWESRRSTVKSLGTAWTETDNCKIYILLKLSRGMSGSVIKKVRQTSLPYLTFLCVFREDEQVLGAILNLVDVREEDYGDYLCRVEMGSTKQRLEMKASLHISPTVARTVSNVHILSTVVAILAAFLIVLFICVVFLRRHHAKRHKLNSLPHREQVYDDSATIEMSFRHPSTSVLRP